MYQGLCRYGQKIYEKLSSEPPPKPCNVFGIELNFESPPQFPTNKLWVAMAANELVYLHHVKKIEKLLNDALAKMHSKVKNKNLKVVENTLHTIVDLWKSVRPLHLDKTWLEDMLFFPEAEKVPDLNQYFSILIPEAHAKIKIKPVQTCNRVDPQELNHYHQKLKPAYQDSSFEFNEFRPSFDSTPNMWRVIVTLQNKNKHNEDSSSSESEIKTVRSGNDEKYAHAVFSFDLPVRTGVFAQRLAMIDMAQALLCAQDQNSCAGHCEMLGIEKRKKGKNQCLFPVHISRHPMKKMK